MTPYQTNGFPELPRNHHVLLVLLPIIALTARAFEKDRQRCLAIGMDEFLTKLISLVGLTSAVGKWFNKSA